MQRPNDLPIGHRIKARLGPADHHATTSWIECGEDLGVFRDLQDPRSYLQEVTGNNRARSQMAFQVRSESDAADVAAYLATFGAQEEPAG